MAFLPAARGTGRKARQRAIGRNVAGPLGPASSVLRSHIAHCALEASPAEQDAGLGWYSCANEIARELGPITESAGIIAALSPQISWSTNVALAKLIYNGADDSELIALGTYDDSVSKARRIYAGELPSSVLGGRKVRSFYRNIVLPDRAGPVTIDRHAVSIALYGIGGPRPSDKYLERAGTYTYIASAYRAEARAFGILPHQLQAICWLVHRRTLDENATGNLAKAHIRSRSNLLEDF